MVTQLAKSNVQTVEIDRYEGIDSWRDQVLPRQVVEVRMQTL